MTVSEQEQLLLGQKQSIRRVFSILSPHSLPYAEKCIESLFRNAIEPLDLKLITDSTNDKQILVNALMNIDNPQLHTWQVIAQSEADAQAESQWKGLEHLKTFRHGHPCWRKVTDPLLFANDEEVIILDPDLYFPNKFTFEPTPDKTLLLMWQPPSCLLPEESVLAAFNAPVKLSNHVDIGVAQLRKPSIDLNWLDWLIGKMGGKDIPQIAHVEAIIWSALAMKMGGGHLNPKHWRCWHRSQWKRVLLKCGVPGIRILQMEDFGSVKCFHAGGISKMWLKEACECGVFESNNTLDQSSTPVPFIEFTLQRYKMEQRLKTILRKTGYHKLINPSYYQ